MKIKFVEVNKKIIKNNEIKRVYDITVKDNHSYTVNNIIVHNCLTTQNTGVGFPMASLIKECYEESLKLDNPSKIVADGGFKEYSDIIKAIALGADYVMLGSLLNKTVESAGQTYVNFLGKWKISNGVAKKIYKKDFFKGRIIKKFRGMSTKEVQKKWGRTKLKTSEGVVRYRPVEYTLDGWVENFSDYLRSAMSYTNSQNIEDFRGKVDLNQITINGYSRFNK